MKKFVYILISWLAIGLNSCDQNIDYPYEGKDRIQFKHFTVDYNSVRHYSDSLVFSFGLMPDSVAVDTLKVVMEYLGKGSDQERTYYISIITDSTTAVAGTHYDAISHEQKFRPNQLTDTLRIPIYRENLSDDYTHPQDMRLELQLENSEDFDLGLRGGIKKKILMNNYLSEPDWWKGNFGTSLGFFHPEKWKILISFNEKFATYTNCPFDNRNEGQEYREGLWWYLYKIVVIDEITGKRITMDGLEDIE